MISSAEVFIPWSPLGTESCSFNGDKARRAYRKNGGRKRAGSLNESFLRHHRTSPTRHAVVRSRGWVIGTSVPLANLCPFISAAAGFSSYFRVRQHLCAPAVPYAKIAFRLCLISTDSIIICTGGISPVTPQTTAIDRCDCMNILLVESLINHCFQLSYAVLHIL